jgi:hypothetical protein
MVPNRRLRDELARADKMARKRRTNFDEQATVVPQEEVVPDATRPGRLRDYADGIGDADSDDSIELRTSDIDISDLSNDSRPVPAAPRAAGLPGMRGPTLPGRNQAPRSPAPPPAPRAQIVIEPQRKKGLFDFGDDDQTRIDLK